MTHATDEAGGSAHALTAGPRLSSAAIKSTALATGTLDSLGLLKYWIHQSRHHLTSLLASVQALTAGPGVSMLRSTEGTALAIALPAGALTTSAEEHKAVTVACF